MSEAYIASALRTPIGKYRGAFKSVRPDDLAAALLQQLAKRTGLLAHPVDEVILGCANQAGEDNRNVARMALLLAGMDQAVTGVTVNRLCGSGLEAIIQAARAIRLNEAALMIAGGVESMTRAPWSLPKSDEGFPLGALTAYDTSLGWRYPNPKLAKRFPLEAMGETAENIADQHPELTRALQDQFALRSHQRAIEAIRSGRFEDEVVAIEVADKKGAVQTISRDEQPREESTYEQLAKLKPAFREGGSVTAGNASSLNDGAAALVMASQSALDRLNMAPLARVVTSAVCGLDPRVMGLGPISACQKLLARAGLRVQDIDLWELNEAFAIQALACQQALQIPDERLNVNGGAIALGHPLGASGARIATTLIHEMRRRRVRYGIATMCIGVGQGIAVLFESCL